MQIYTMIYKIPSGGGATPTGPAPAPQAGPGPSPGPGRTGRPRRRLEFCMSWYIFVYLGYIRIFFWYIFALVSAGLTPPHGLFSFCPRRWARGCMQQVQRLARGNRTRGHHQEQHPGLLRVPRVSRTYQKYTAHISNIHPKKSKIITKYQAVCFVIWF